MKVVNHDRLGASPDRVGELFCSEEFLVRGHSAREEVADARYERTDEPDGTVVIVVHCRQYRRRKTGGLDRRNSDPTTVTYRWYPAEGRASWAFDGPDGDRVQIRGKTRFEPDGDGTVVTEEVDVVIRVPLIGRMIERVVARGMDRTFDTNRKLVRELL